MRRLAALAAASLLAALAAGCSSKVGPTGAAPTRTYRMGFASFPPRPDLALLVQTVQTWAQRADAGLILSEPPWDSLIAGVSPETLVRRNELGLAEFYRALGLRVVCSIDPTNGLDRSSDSAPLVAAGRSLTEPAIQQLYRDYAVAMDTLVRPDYLSVASETNLIRAIAPPALYSAVVQNAADAAAAVRAADPSVQLYTTVQVEVAWGRLVPAGTFQGIAQDRADFPFIQALGISSYPYLGGWGDPDNLPPDYYTRLVQGSPIPVLMIEGGWSSDTVLSVPCTPDHQRRYIEKHAQLLDAVQAVAWFQITFTDLDVAAYQVQYGDLTPFAYLGLVDVNLMPKPALAPWDAIFRRQRQ
jgi:hypothetical protein